MKILRYLALTLLIIEGVAGFFPQVFDPLLGIGFGIITFRRFLGALALFTALVIVFKKDDSRW